MGEEAIQYCRSYAFEAERRMGEILKATELAIGARPKGSENHLLPGRGYPKDRPTLAEFNIDGCGIQNRRTAEGHPK
jgi:hypothetical protein